jgi:hypothetical protein
MDIIPTLKLRHLFIILDHDDIHLELYDFALGNLDVYIYIYICVCVNFILTILNS